MSALREGSTRGLGWASRVQGYHTAHHSSFHRSEVKEASRKVTRRANTNTQPPQHPSRAEIWFSRFLFCGCRAPCVLRGIPPQNLSVSIRPPTHGIIVVLSIIGMGIVIYTSSHAHLYVHTCTHCAWYRGYRMILRIICCLLGPTSSFHLLWVPRR